MARTHLTKKQLRNATFDDTKLDSLKAKLDEHDHDGDTLDTLVLGSAGFLTADAAGRAVMATGYFTEAAATDKFAAQAITGSLLKNSTVTSTQLASNAVTTAKITDANVTAAKLEALLLGEASTRSGAGAVAITKPTALVTSTGAGNALTVADSTLTGQRLRIVHTVDGGSAVITQTTGAKLSAGVTTITFTNRFDWVELEWSGALWEIIGYGGVTVA